MENNENNENDVIITGVIYKFTNNINGKHYIGQSINERVRYQQHLCGHDCKIDQKIQQYGIDNFSYNIIYSITDNSIKVLKELRDKEIYYIKYYNSIYPNGYNMNRGGANKHILHDNTIKQIKETTVKDNNRHDKLVNLPNEIWKDIPDFKYYQASNLGRIKVLQHRTKYLEKCTNRYKYRTVKEQICQPFYDDKGSLRIQLVQNGKGIKKSVAQLIGITFIPKENEKLNIVIHLNGKLDDNRIENLKWSSIKERQNMDVVRNKIKQTNTNNNLHYIYQYNRNKEFIAKWESTYDIQETLGYDSRNIRSCCIGLRKTAYNYIWEYIDK